MTVLSKDFTFILPILGLAYLYFVTHSSRDKPKNVCKPVRNWKVVPKAVKIAAKRKVLKHFPFASVNKFHLPSKKNILIDRRNEAFSQKGYFVVGFDNGKTSSRHLSEYDFYVTYNNDTGGSHFFLKPFTIRKSIEGCQKHVKFVYKDHDAILKPILSNIGFHHYKIAFQTEFHNSSANAGLITGRASDRTKQIIAEWDGGSGIGQNMEKDQTVLRALVEEDENSFFRLPPNSVARHIYSSSKYRLMTTSKTRIRYADTNVHLYCLLAAGLFSHLCKKLMIYKSNGMLRNSSYWKMKIYVYNITPTVLIFLILALLNMLVSCPICLSRALGVPEILNLGMYHSAIQLQADDLVRVWSDRSGFHIGTPHETFRIPFLRLFSPIIISNIYDGIFILICVLPLKTLTFYFALIRAMNFIAKKNPI